MQPQHTIRSNDIRSARKMLTRIIIYPKDVKLITGRSHRTACRMLNDIRQAMGKTRQQLVSIEEFCRFMNMDEAVVKEFLNE